MATYGAISCTFNNDIAKRFALFESRVLRRMFRDIKVNENWRKQCNEELIKLFGNNKHIFICQNKSAELNLAC